MYLTISLYYDNDHGINIQKNEPDDLSQLEFVPGQEH